MGSPDEARRQRLTRLRQRLDLLAEFEDASQIGQRVARLIAEHTRGPGLTRAEVRHAGHASCRRAEWNAVVHNGWIVTRNRFDCRWLEARRGERVVRALTFAALCAEMATQQNYSQGGDDVSMA